MDDHRFYLVELERIQKASAKQKNNLGLYYDFMRNLANLVLTNQGLALCYSSISAEQAIQRADSAIECADALNSFTAYQHNLFSSEPVESSPYYHMHQIHLATSYGLRADLETTFREENNIGEGSVENLESAQRAIEYTAEAIKAIEQTDPSCWDQAGYDSYRFALATRFKVAGNYHELLATALYEEAQAVEEEDVDAAVSLYEQSLHHYTDAGVNFLHAISRKALLAEPVDDEIALYVSATIKANEIKSHLENQQRIQQISTVNDARRVQIIGLQRKLREDTDEIERISAERDQLGGRVMELESLLAHVDRQATTVSAQEKFDVASGSDGVDSEADEKQYVAPVAQAEDLQEADEDYDAEPADADAIPSPTSSSHTELLLESETRFLPVDEAYPEEFLRLNYEANAHPEIASPLSQVQSPLASPHASLLGVDSRVDNDHAGETTVARPSSVLSTVSTAVLSPLASPSRASASLFAARSLSPTAGSTPKPQLHVSPPGSSATSESASSTPQPQLRVSLPDSPAASESESVSDGVIVSPLSLGRRSVA